MTPRLPFADPIPMPAPEWLLWFLLVLTFVLHVLPMNLALGGAIIGVVSRWRARREPLAGELAAFIARALPAVIASAVSMGVATLLFLQVLYGRVFFSAAILQAAPWIAVVPLLVTGYYAAYAGAFRSRSGGGGQTVLAWVAAGAFVAVGFIYSNVMSLVLRPEQFADRFAADATGLHLNLGDPTLLPRFLHVVLGSLAVSGLALAIAGATMQTRRPAFASWLVRHGVFWFGGATVANFVPGFWWLAVLPRDTLLRFMGQDAVATTWFGLGIVAALGALAHAVQAAVGRQSPRVLAAAGGSLVVSLVAMVLVRDTARSASLQAAGLAAPSWVAPQWGPIAIFAVLLAAAGATVWWMVAKLVSSRTS